MRKFLTLAIVFVVSGLCAHAGEKLTIGAAIRKYDDTFLTEHRNAMKARCDELGVNVDFTDSRADQILQNNNIDMYITKAYDAITVNLQERSAADIVIEKCMNADIPLVIYISEPFPEAMKIWEKVYYVGSRAEDSGLNQAYAMADYWNAHKKQVDRNGDGKLQIVILTGEPGHNDAELRTEYCQRGLKERGIEFELVAKDTAMWDRVKGQDKMATFLAAYDNIEAVFCNNDDMALGAIEALKAQGYFSGDKYMPVLGVDATAVGKDAIREGTMLATSFNDAKGQGGAVAQIAYLLAKDMEVTPETVNIPAIEYDGRYLWMPYIAVNKDNVEEFTSR